MFFMLWPYWDKIQLQPQNVAHGILHSLVVPKPKSQILFCCSYFVYEQQNNIWLVWVCTIGLCNMACATCCGCNRILSILVCLPISVDHMYISHGGIYISRVRTPPSATNRPRTHVDRRFVTPLKITNGNIRWLEVYFRSHITYEWLENIDVCMICTARILNILCKIN